MRDLLLFRLLRDEAHEDPRLPSLLSELEGVPLRSRIPYFAWLWDLVTSEKKPMALRVPALRALEGADDAIVLEAALEALEVPELFEPAFVVLRSAASRAPARLAHLLFHPRAEVRSRAVQRCAPAPHLEFYLLSDPALREEVIARGAVREAPDTAISAVFDFHARGLLPVEEARRLLRGKIAALAGWSQRVRARQPELVKQFLDSCQTEAPSDALLEGAPDDIDMLVELMWEPDFFLGLARVIRGVPSEPRFVASMIARARATGAWPKGALGALAAMHPASLAFPWIDRARRRVMLSELYDAPPRRPPGEIMELAKSSITRHEDGSLDLFAVGALLQLSANDPYKLLFEWFAVEEIDQALARRPIESAPILHLWDDTGRRRVIDIAARATRKTLLLELARNMPEGQLHFLHFIDGDEKGFLANGAGQGFSELFRALIVAPPLEEARATKLAEIAGGRMNARSFEDVIGFWLEHPRATGESVGRAVMLRAGQILDANQFTALAKNMKSLSALLTQIARAPSFPWQKEKALALALLEHPAPEVRAWAEERAPLEQRAYAPEPVMEEVSAETLAGASEEELPRLLKPFLRGDRAGLALAMAGRASAPSAQACVALLASNDPLEETARELARFSALDDALQKEIDAQMVDAFAYRDVALSPFGHAVLWRWDVHGKRFIDGWLAAHGDLAGAVRAARAVPLEWLRDDVSAALANAFALLAAREPARFAALITPEALEALVDALPTSLEAARALAVVYQNLRASSELVLPRVRLMLPELDAPIRDAINAFIDSAGLPERRAPKPPEPALDEVTLARVKSLTDVEELSRLARSQRSRVVHEAALRLIELGERGQLALLELLARSSADEIDERRPILESLTLFSEGESLRWVRVLCEDASRPAELRFRAAIALAERGDVMKAALLEAALAPSESRWFEPKDWEKLARFLGTDKDGLDEMARALTTSPHPNAHVRAVEHVLEKDPTEEGRAALRAFLECGTKRMGSLRRRAATALFLAGDWDVFPLVVEQHPETGMPEPYPHVRSPRLLDLVVRSLVMAAPNIAKEPAALAYLARLSPFEPHAQDGYAWLADRAGVEHVRAKSIQAISRGPMRARRVRAIAEAFAWGQDRSRELTGRVFRVQMTSGKSLGYTRFRENKVFVSPMPILRGDRFGHDVVRGLVLHELGHHMYHRGKEREKVWEQAQREGIHGLLNLVADEHLERNVRAIDQDYGDLLKRLAAFAFQHSEREIKLETLLQMLQGRAFEVLSGARLGVARDPGSVKVDSGALLRTMERAELPFARFMRALRMGLGNRAGDPRVEQGLDLFRDRFRKSEMQSLLDVARQLRALFGWETQIVEHFGTHESLEEGDGSEWGISDDEIEREVERVREPQQRREREDDGRPGGRPWLNIEPKVHFDKIQQVKKMPFDARAHAPYAKKVERNAQLLRRYLEELGLSLIPVRQRLSGHRLDTTRLRSLVLRRDPRILVSRTKNIAADVFVGIVIDCSGSMASGGNMERAKHFAVLMAEAAATLRGVDVRVFGFTDRVIYDCGDARRCAAHTLTAGGGNNDAAALWHAANVAKSSHRRAKLLVMISDGLPTECSVDALRHLVQLLTKREKMVCAQVAVQPISEICFPHYVVVKDGDEDSLVRRFGEILVRLVKSAIAA